MTILFGQFPQNAMLLGQFALHATVGSVADIVTPPVGGIGGGGGGGWTPSRRTYVRRSEVTPTPPKNDEDLVAALTVFMLLERNQSP